jgi:hypothetical protein
MNLRVRDFRTSSLLRWLARPLPQGLDLLWLAGLAVLVAWVLERLLPGQSERKDWAMYLAVGAALPLSLLILRPATGEPAASWLGRVQEALRKVLCTVALVASFRLLFPGSSYWLWVALPINLLLLRATVRSAPAVASKILGAFCGLSLLQLLPLGKVVPAAVIVSGTSLILLALVLRFVPARARVLLGVFWILATAQLVLLTPPSAVWPLSLGSLALLWGVLSGQTLSTRPRFALLFVALPVCWALALRFEWWEPFNRMLGAGGPWHTLYVVSVIAAALLLVFHAIRPLLAPASAALRLPRLLDLGSILPFVVFAALSLRTDGLFEWVSFHHWSFYIGPTELVRQGGWLLWDVPSQYGFLSILSLAVSPLQSAWQALYVANAFLIFLSACFVFWLLRSLRPGLLNWLFAFVATVAVIYLLSGAQPQARGPQEFPSIAAFRFFWCYALLAVLLWGSRADAAKPVPDRLLIVGTAVWLVGCLWSFESAIYCSGIWLPAYVVMVLGDSRWSTRGWRKWWAPALLRLAAPVAAMAAALGLVSAIYLLRLGHAPDWRCYFEHSMAYSTRVCTFAIEPSGPGTTLLLIYCGLAGLLGAAFLTRGASWPVRSLVLGTGAMFWVSASYFIGRSTGQNATNLAPQCLTAVALSLMVLQTAIVPARARALIAVSLWPVLATLLFVPLSNAGAVRGLVHALGAVPTSHIENKLRILPAEGQALLSSAGITGEATPIFLDDQSGSTLLGRWRPAGAGPGELQTVSHSWLPFSPLITMAPIVPARRITYLTRFAERHPDGGWLLYELSKTHPDEEYGDVPYIRDYLRTHYVATSTRQAEGWELVHYQRRAQESGSP